MAKRKLRLEIQQSDEHGECGSSRVPRWHGQHSLTTEDITGSVMKILITDSKGKQIAITIGNNGSIKEVDKNQEIKEEHGISISSSNLQIEGQLDVDKNIHPYLEKNQQSMNSENDVGEISNSVSRHVKQELKEYEEPATESTISFKEVVRVTSEGYKLDTLEPDMEEEFHTEIDETKSEDRSLAGKFETVYIDSEMLLCENDEFPRAGQSSEISSSILQSTNDTALLCRLCATQRKDMIYIFESNETYKNIIGKIQDCLHILVRRTDTLPKQVCRLCLEKLEMFHKFHKTVTEAEKQFNNLGEKMSEALKHTDKNVQTSLPQNEQLNAEKCSKKSVSIKKFCSLPVTFKTPEILNNPKESVNKTNTDEIIFIGEEAVIDDHNEEFDIIKCRICGLFFGTAKSCYLHSEMHNTENYYPCSMCSKILTNQSDSLKHSRQHVAPKQKQRRAPIYNKDEASQSENNLPSIPIADEDNAGDNNILGIDLVENETSIAKKNDQDMIKCRICGKYFGTAKSCYTHSMIHASQDYMPCSMCDKIFINAKDSSNHSLEHILPKFNQIRAMMVKKKLSDNSQSFVLVKKSSTIFNNEKISSEKDRTDDDILSIEETVKDQASIDQSNNSNMIRCRFCGCTFPDAKSCYTHGRIHVREAYYPCTMCDKTFTVAKHSWRHNLDHIAVEEKKRKLSENVCHSCGKRYVSEARLRFHQICHNPKMKACYCEKCDKILPSEESLFYHMGNMHKKHAKEFGCEICEKRFRNQLDFNSHQVKHDHPNFACTLCNEKFYASDKLKLHKPICPNKKKYSCSHCEKIFLYKVSMIKHMKEHSAGSLPYRCNICPKTFPTYETRNAHLFTHIDKLWECDICNQKFIRSSTMRIHKRTRHNI